MKTQKFNGLEPTNPTRDILTASMVRIIEERRVELVLSSMIPKITDFDGLDVSVQTVTYNKGYFTGKSQITNLRPNTVPTVQLDSENVTEKLYWNSAGIRISRADRDLQAAGKTKFENKTLAALRIVAEGEDSILKKGIDALGQSGLEGVKGVNIVAQSGKWNTLTGEQIVEEIRKARAAHVKGMKFNSDELWLDDTLYEELQKAYSETVEKSILTIIKERNWFKEIKPVPEFGTGVIVEKSPANFGFVEDSPIQLTDQYKEGTDDIYMVEQHLSGLIVFQPHSITRLEGAM